MDNKITKSRLSNLLSYDWLKIIAFIAAVCFVWVLAFTVGAPRASVGQLFGLITYAPDFDTAKSESQLLYEAKEKGAFSFDVLDFNTRSIQKDYYSTLMMAANSVQEGDIFITSDFEDSQEKNESPMRSFIDSYYSAAFDMDSLIVAAKDYALKHGIVYKDGAYSCNNSITDSVFAQRMEKDPRFRDKQSARYTEGLKSEAERVVAVWNNACKLEKVLKEHPELRVNYRPFTQTLAAMDEDKRENSDYYKVWQNKTELTYAIDLGKLTGGSEKITDLYSRTVTPEDGEPYLTADGIVLCVFDYTDKQPDLQYETLGYIVYMVETYSDFLSVEPDNLIK